MDDGARLLDRDPGLQLVAHPLDQAAVVHALDLHLLVLATPALQLALDVALFAGEIAEAEQVREAFRAARARVPKSRIVHNNTVPDLLGIAEAMLTGELEYRRGNVELAFAELRRAVALDDALPYDEPWGWMQPTRHALGALLLEQGRLAEAEAVYRADLGYDGKLARSSQHPDNVWALHGLVECLQRRGEREELPALEAKLAAALAKVDVPITSSCMCRTKTQPKDCCCT